MAGAGPTPGLPGAGGPVVQGPGAGIPGKIGEERLKEMEAEMALFEQEVLGAPVTGIPTAVPTVPTVESMQVPAAPVIRPIIATNTYQQVQQTLEARAAAAATVVSPMAKVIRDKRTGKTKGYGFVSFKDPSDYVRAMREMNGKYVGSRPIKLRKSMWKDRNLDVVRKKQKEKKKLGLR
ncbi:RNA binding motif protein 42 [Rhinolophus ferrumequinum]|uniref:RNA binding motif protein 42 n=1 Tax=Rhinolophus ferrumequinum TaxID=59479 RepID=A0A671EUL0_RHIFE|nr:RNA binding motif protein 42 [Rhinolophus ferrumequinum]